VMKIRMTDYHISRSKMRDVRAGAIKKFPGLVRLFCSAGKLILACSAKF